MDGLKVSHALVALLGVIIFSTLTVSTAQPILETYGGQVRGLETQVNGRTVDVFYGIPYAAPPVGDLRFKPPVAVPKWTTARDGTVKPAACWQLENVGNFDRFEGLRIWKPTTGVSEDCLYVNVWRPEEGPGPKKIMVWIHGGGFWAGSAVLDAYDGSQLPAREDVILVTIAYRLGVPGFLKTSDKTAGNVGLFDQRMALEWVRKNAANLGGSQDDITIFGEDAGATSVGFHLMTPSTLFTNAIMQSGSPLAPWAVMDRNTAFSRSVDVVESLGCNMTIDEVEFTSCVNGLSVEALTKKFLEMELGLFELPLGPVIDGEIVVYHPEKSLKSDNIKITDVFIGVNKNEGILAFLYAFQDKLLKRGRIRRIQELRDMMLKVANGDKDLQKVLLKEYNSAAVTKNWRREMMDAAIGDSLIKCPALDFARKYTRRGGRVYLYSFEDRYSFNTWPEWVGVPHGSEVEIVFGTPLEENSGMLKEERYRIEEIMDRWASFAKTGNPSGHGLQLPRFTLENGEYLKFDPSGLTPAKNFRQNTCSAWLGNRGSGSGPNSGKPGPEKTAPETEKKDPESEKPAPEAEQTAPEPEKQAPEAEQTAPESEKQAPESEKQAPESEKQVAEADKPAPESESDKPVPEADKPVPEADEPVPEADEPVPEADKPVPEADEPVPEADKLVPEADKPVPEADKPVPEADKPVPEADEPVPEADKPVPEADKPVPEADEPAPESEKQAPEAEKTEAEVEKPAAGPAKPAPGSHTISMVEHRPGTAQGSFYSSAEKLSPGVLGDFPKPERRYEIMLQGSDPTNPIRVVKSLPSGWEKPYMRKVELLEPVDDEETARARGY